MSEADVDAALQGIFRDALKQPEVVLTREMQTGAVPGWDSMANVEVLIGCEIRWGFEFDATEIDAIRSYGDLIDAIARHVD